MGAAVVVMGVTGSGKTTVGALLAGRLGWDFEEGDSLHPPENVAKMSSGQPLTDDDRWPWLTRIGEWIDEEGSRGRSAVVSCSALKRSYRDLLCAGRPELRFLYLAGTRKDIADRLAQRQGHFMPPSLLDSQFADLQALQPDEPGFSVGIAGGPEEIVAEAIELLKG